MSGQFALPFGAPTINAVKIDAETLAGRFQQFHNANPLVYASIRAIAMKMLASGWKRGSINMIFERLRWEHAIVTRGDAYKLNNSYRAFYARMLMAAEPTLDGFFSVRSQQDEWSPVQP